MFKKYLVIIAISLSFFGNVNAACNADGTAEGRVEANIVGIEYQEHCTFLLLDDGYTEVGVTATDNPVVLDSNPFVPGRFVYLSIDPENAQAYKSLLSIATMALATDTKIYAQYRGRTGNVLRLSVSKKKR